IFGSPELGAKPIKARGGEVFDDGGLHERIDPVARNMPAEAPAGEVVAVATIAMASRSITPIVAEVDKVPPLAVLSAAKQPLEEGISTAKGTALALHLVVARHSLDLGEVLRADVWRVVVWEHDLFLGFRGACPRVAP